MNFLTHQYYEQYVYRFYYNDDGTFVVDVFEEDNYRQRRKYNNYKDIIEYYGKYFPDLESIISKYQ